MRIVHVTSYFPPDRVGGVGTVVDHIHRGLLERGHRSIVVTTGTSVDDPTVLRFGANPQSFAMKSLRAVKLLKEADVVHHHHGEALPLMAVARIRHSRAPNLVTMHVSNHRIGLAHRRFRLGDEVIGGGVHGVVQSRIKAPLKVMLDTSALRMADAVSFISEAGASEILGDPPGAEPTIILNGVEPCRAKSSQNGRMEHVEVLFVGTGDTRKRVILLPDILREIRSSLAHVRLRIVGLSESDQPSALRRFRDFGLEQEVVWEGEVLPSEVYRYWGESDALVVPSSYEGLPMVILEAMSCGLPVVATDTGGNREIIDDGVNGYLAKVDHPPSIALGLVRILSDPALRDRMSRMAREIVARKFSVDQQVESYVALYERLRDQAS